MAEAVAAGGRPINGARRQAWIVVRAAERGRTTTMLLLVLLALLLLCEGPTGVRRRIED